MAKLAKALYNREEFAAENPWTTLGTVGTVDIIENKNIMTTYRTAVDACRFFYKHDPLCATVINKMVEIGITDLKFYSNKLTTNEMQVFWSLGDKLKEYAETLALEFLLSGLVLPEISYGKVKQDEVKLLRVKKYPSLVLPLSMWIRDPMTIKINQSILSDQPSYSVELTGETVDFIKNKGKFTDGTEDKELYDSIRKMYPDFVKAIDKGDQFFPIENTLAFRRRAMTSDPYPVPYLYPALESLRHKRNLRRMDYSIAARVISAIQLVKLGSDEFPVTEEDGADLFNEIKMQMRYRSGQDVDRIFQLFANHTLQIEWVYPPTEALLNDTKYKEVNQDIIFALGFPRVLITGEAEKTGTSDATYATMSPVKTMENFRSKIIKVLQNIVDQIAVENNFKMAPDVIFEKLQLAEFGLLMQALTKLYDSGNISRDTFTKFFGYDWNDEFDKKVEEQKLLDTSNVPEFAPQAFTQQPGKPGAIDNTKVDTKTTDKKPTDTTKPAAKPAADTQNQQK